MTRTFLKTISYMFYSLFLFIESGAQLLTFILFIMIDYIYCARGFCAHGFHVFFTLTMLAVLICICKKGAKIKRLILWVCGRKKGV